jgi:hypothetical protein
MIFLDFFYLIFLLILPLCSIYRHGGHDGWSAGSSDISFKGNPLRMIQTKFGLNWPSGFRGEHFWKSLQTDDGRQVMAIAHTGELKMNVSVICTHILMEFFFNETCIVLLCNYFRFWHKRGPKGEFLINQRGCMDRCTYMGKSLCT